MQLRLLGECQTWQLGCPPSNSAEVVLHKVVGWVPPPAISAQIVNSTCSVPSQAGEAKSTHSTALRVLPRGFLPSATRSICSASTAPSQDGCRAAVLTNRIVLAAMHNVCLTKLPVLSCRSTPDLHAESAELRDSQAFKLCHRACSTRLCVC